MTYPSRPFLGVVYASGGMCFPDLFQSMRFHGRAPVYYVGRNVVGIR